jgi:cysteinyl-tRNA synthetase
MIASSLTLLCRTYVSIDILQRILTDYFNIQVLHVMGMTDVDDKIIRRAAEKNCSMQELAVQQEEYFWKDMAALGVRLLLTSFWLLNSLQLLRNFLSAPSD